MIDTTSEFVTAYCVAAALFIGYALTLWWRARKVSQRLDARRKE
jgi:hypothetical protein